MKDKRILYVGYGIVAVLFYMAYSRNEKSKKSLQSSLDRNKSDIHLTKI
jgi:hypothetical protein